MSDPVEPEVPSTADEVAEAMTVAEPGDEEAEATTATPSVVNGDDMGTSMPEALRTTIPRASAANVTIDRDEDRGSNDGDDAAAPSTAAENTVEMSGVPPNDVKNIILQVLSPYFDDEGGEDDAQRYDHIKAQGWIQLICDGIMEKLLAMRRPYKYVVHCMIMRKCGAGIHVCSSCYYGQVDGWVNHAHDLSAHIYAVVTVYWSVI